MFGANPIRDHVDGAPYQPGQIVRVVDAVDTHVHDVSACVGQYGTVAYLEYECGCGQTYPDGPMIGVVLVNGKQEEFWSEELRAVTAPPLRPRS